MFGYYLEVTNSFKDMVPDYYTRKQTLTNAERYITPELKELEDIILGAEDKLFSLEYNLFSDVRDTDRRRGRTHPEDRKSSSGDRCLRFFGTGCGT